MHGLVRQLTGPDACSTLPRPFVIHVPKQMPLWVVKSLRYLPAKRVTFSGYWSHQPVIAKLFFAKKRAQQHFLSELNGLRVMQARNIATAPILYAGDGAWPGSYMIITGFLLGAKTYDACLQDLTLRQRYAESFIDMLQRMHNAGMIQKDLHGGNFLNWQGQWYCLDGDGIHFQKKSICVARKVLIENLSLACIQLLSIFPEIELDKLIQSIMPKYAAKIGRHLDKKIKHRLKARFIAFHEMIMNKSIRKCTDYGVVSTKKYHGYYQKRHWDTTSIAEIFETEKRETASVSNMAHHREHPTLGPLRQCSYPITVTCDTPKKRVSAHKWIRAWRYSQLLAYQNIPALAIVAMQLSKNRSHRGWIKAREGLPLLQYVSQHQHDTDKIQFIINQMHSILKRMQQLRLYCHRTDIHCFAVDNDTQVFLTHVDSVKHYRFDFSFKQAIKKQGQQWLTDLQDFPVAHHLLRQAMSQ